MSTTRLQSARDTLRQTRIIFLSLITVVVLFFLVAFFIVEGRDEKILYIDGLLFYIIPPIAFILAVLGKVIYDKKRKSAFDKPVNEKAILFMQHNIIKYALWEGASFLCLVAFLISGSYFFLVLLAGIVSLLLINTPTKSRFTFDYKLDPSEVEEIFKEQPDTH